jgi:hypothetical protein
MSLCEHSGVNLISIFNMLFLNVSFEFSIFMIGFKYVSFHVNSVCYAK